MPVLAAGPNADNELLLSNKTQREVVARLGPNWTVSMVCFIGAGIFGVAAALSLLLNR